MTKTPCYCSSLPQSHYAEKDTPKPKCDFCAGLRKAPAPVTTKEG